jgi:hypothetical protein
MNNLENTLKEIGFLCIDFKGTSMRPLFIEGRDKVCIYSYEPNSPLKNGDIILYKREPELYVLHRIMAKKGDGYVLCGDNHTTLEYGVKPSQILGVAKGYYKYDKYVDFDKSIKYKLYKNTFGKFRIFRKIRNLFLRIFKVK